jgi:hypothetical protein
MFLVFNGEVGALPWLGTVGSARPFCAIGKQVSWHPQADGDGRLPLSRGAGFPLFDQTVRALPQEGFMISLRPP